MHAQHSCFRCLKSNYAVFNRDYTSLVVIVVAPWSRLTCVSSLFTNNLQVRNEMWYYLYRQDILGASRYTIYRRLHEEGRFYDRYTNISDQDLERTIAILKVQHPKDGEVLNDDRTPVSSADTCSKSSPSCIYSSS